MKTSMFVVSVLAATSLALSQGKSYDGISRYYEGNYSNKLFTFEQAMQNLVGNLSHENVGVVKSALSHLVRVRVANPQLSMDKAQTEIKDLIEEGETPAIRYEAFLANAVLENPGLVSLSDCNDCGAPENLFSVIATRLSDATFGPTSPSFSSAR